MKFDKEPTDEQLDALLGDIDVPQDLKSSLRQIPLGDKLESDTKVGLNAEEATTEEEPSWTGALLGLILAASLMGVGLFIASGSLPDTGGDSPIAKSPSNVKTDDGNDGDSVLGNSVAVADVSNAGDIGELAQSEIEAREIEALEAQIRGIEIARMETQLLDIERTTAGQVDQHEVESVIAAVAEQYSIPLGMPEAKAKSRMAQVIKQFPGTRGAEMAQSFLEQIQNN